MRRKGKKKKIKLGKIVLLVLLIYIGILFIRQYKTINQFKAQKMQKEKDKQELEKDISELNEWLNLMNSPEFTQKFAREMGMVYPWETVYIDMEKSKKNFMSDVDN